MMFFYITTEENCNRFDFLKENYILNKEIKRSLNFELFMKFLKKDMRNLEIDVLILDLNIFAISDITALKEAFESFYLLYPESRIIIVPAEEGSAALYDLKVEFAKLYILSEPDNPEIEIYNIIDSSDSPVNNTTEEVDITQSENSTMFYEDNLIKEPDIYDNTELVEEKVFPEELIKKPVKINEGQPLKSQNLHKEYQEDKVAEVIKEAPQIMKLHDYIKEKDVKNKWSCRNFMIGVMGVERKIGTTTTAFQLSCYLQGEGGKVSYVEANTHNHLNFVASENDFIKVKDYYLKKSITYFPEYMYDANAGVNFIIFDLGCITENTDKVNQFAENMDKLFLVSGGQPYEYSALDAAINVIADNSKINIIFNHVTESRLVKLKKKYLNEAKCITYIKNCADILLPSGVAGNSELEQLFNEIK